jgi:hypothetical protein
MTDTNTDVSPHENVSRDCPVIILRLKKTVSFSNIDQDTKFEELNGATIFTRPPY